MQGGAHIQEQNVISGAAGGAAKTQPNSREDTTAERLTGIWQDLLGVKSITPDQNYFDLGGDSSLAVQLFSRISDVFKIQLPLATLFDAPTIGELSQVLRHEVKATKWSSLVAIQPKGSRPPFICIHGAGGNLLIYRDLSRRLGPDQPFYGLQAQGLDGISAPLSTIREMAELYVGEIRKVCPQGPYYLGGYCMGGTVAYEVAQQLSAQGEKVAMLALFDTMNWSKIPVGSVLDHTYREFQRLAFHVANFLCLDIAGMMKFLSEKLEILRDRFPVWMGMLLGRMDTPRFRKTMPESRALGRLWRLNDKACLEYVPQLYPGKITDFRPRKQYRQFDKPEAKWDSLAREGQEVFVLPVYPAGMLVEPFVKHLAEALRESIDKAMSVSR